MALPKACRATSGTFQKPPLSQDSYQTLLVDFFKKTLKRSYAVRVKRRRESLCVKQWDLRFWGQTACVNMLVQQVRRCGQLPLLRLCCRASIPNVLPATVRIMVVLYRRASATPPFRCTGIPLSSWVKTNNNERVPSVSS